MEAFEESATLPRWGLRPGSGRAAYQRQTADSTVQGSALTHFVVDRAFTSRLMD